MTHTPEHAIMQLEEKFWQTMLNRDTEASITMLPHQSIIAGAQGHMVLTHEDYRRMAREGEKVSRLRSFTIENARVLFPGEDVAVIAYTVSVEMDFKGEAKRLSAADTTTWVQQDGKWLAAMHSETPLGDTLPDQKVG